MSGWKRTAIQFRIDLERESVPIINDRAMISYGLASSRMIPLLIIDTSMRPDIEDIVRFYNYHGIGDVVVAWALTSSCDKNHILFILTMRRPSRCVVILQFNIERQARVLDQIIHAQAVYIQAGRIGDRLKTTINNYRMLVDLSTKQVEGPWEGIFRRVLTNDYRSRGFGLQDSRRISQDFIKAWRHLGSPRLSEHCV